MGRKRTGAVAELGYLNGISNMDFPALKHDAKNALVGKDAIAGKIVNRAACMADFSNLADLDQHVAAYLDPRAKGERVQVDALGRKVLAKIAFVYVEPARLCRNDSSAAKKETWRCQCPACASEARPNCSMTVSCPSATGVLRVPLCGEVLIEITRAGPL